MDRPESSYYLTIKTICDYMFSVLGLVFLSPIIILLSVLIFATGKGAVIFTQKRFGKDRRIFMIYKFRSLVTGSEEGINLIKDKNDARVSRIGSLMRKYRLDEMPNLINVLKGEMSLVGPRPEQPYFVDRICLNAPRYEDLLKVKPGVTSWGEVKYGYASNIDQMIERMEYDLYYLENRSLWFDSKIILHTIAVILKGRGM